VSAKVDEVTLKETADAALSDDFFNKCNADKALSDDLY
jgi:hypothetical protein